MPPSQRSSGRSADESSGGRGSGRRAKYIDVDIDSDMVGKWEKRSHSRSDGRPPASTAGTGHAWSGTTELNINLQVEVGDRKFYLHKFPVLSKSGKLNRLIFELRNTRKDHISLSEIPGGSQAFELLAKFLYGGKINLTPLNAATIRCAAEYLDMTDTLGDGNLVSKAEYYLNFYVMDSWRDCITVLKSCSELAPWAEDLEIVRRCADAIAHKCSNDPPYGTRWNGSSSSTKARDWWFDDVCTLSIEFFGRVIHALSGKGQALVAAAVGYYAEKWLQLTKGSDMSTTLKLTKEESSQAASFVAFTGFNQDIVAKDTTQVHLKNRTILHGIVNLLPPQLDSMSVKFLLKLLRVACLVNAGPLCKTDLAKRIGSQLEKVSLVDLLIPAPGDSTYDVDVVQQIVEFYIQDQSYGNSPPLSPRSSLSGSSLSGASSRTSSLNSSRRSLSSVSSSDLSRSLSGSSLSDSSFSGSSMTSGSSVTTDSRSGRSVSGSSDSGSSSVRSSDTGSSISRSSSDLSSRSSGSSFRSTSNSETTESSRSSHASSDSSSSSSGLSSDESVKLEKKPFYAVTESPRNRKSQLSPTTANFKVAQLLETYLEEIAKDSSIALEKFIRLAELFTEFPRDSDDSIYRAIDGFLRAHPSLTDLERKNLCRLMDTGALSLGASAHAASNERLPVRVVVQVKNILLTISFLFGCLPSFSSTTSTTSSSESSSDATSSTTTSSGTTSSSSSSGSDSTSTDTKSRSPSISSASELNHASARTKSIARSPSVASVVSSQLLGGLSIKETLRFVLAEIESLRKSVQEIETVKSRLSLVDTLQLEMQKLSTKFQEMSLDYVEMTQQVEELTKGSKSKDKSGWTSGWKKVAKSFQSKDSQEHPKTEIPPLAAAKLAPAKLAPPKLQIPDVPALPALRTSKSDNLHPKTPRAESTLQTKNARADSLPVTKTSKGDYSLLPKTPRGDSLAVGSKIPRADSLPIPKTANVADMCPKTPRASAVGNLSGPLRKDIVDAQTPRPSMVGAFGGPLKVKEFELQTPRTSVVGAYSGPMKSNEIQTPRESFKVAQETPRSVTPTLRRLDKDMALEMSPFFKDRRKEDYNITAQRSQHVEDVHCRSIRSRSTSPDYLRPPRHHKESDTVSVTSTSSYSSYSTAASSVSGLSRNRYRDRGKSKNGSLEKRHSRHRHSSTHNSERSAGHRRHVGVGSEEHHGPSHRKHRQKEGPEHRSTSHHSGQNGQSQKDHVSVDSHPSQHSSHHRHKEGSGASYHTKDGSEHHSSHRGGHRKDRY